MANMQSLMESWRRFEILEEVLSERSVMKEKYPYKAIYVVGPAGAGKGYLGGRIGIPSDFITANTDERVENVFKAFDIPLAFSQEEGSDLDRLQQNVRTLLQNAAGSHTTNLVLKGAPLLFDTTGENVGKISGRASRLVDLGYDVAIFQIVVPPETSVKRDVERGESGGRSVGAERVKEINNKYQTNVVQGKGYSKAAGEINKAAGGSFVKVLGDVVIPNIYALEDFEGFKAGDLTVSPEAAAAVGNPSFKQVQSMVKKAASDLQGFLGGISNPKGAAILAGQKALIGAMGSEKLEGVKGFSRGQSVRDLWAVRGTKWAQIPAVAAALNAMGGDPGQQVKGAVRDTAKPLKYGDAPQRVGDVGHSDERARMSKKQAGGRTEYER